MADLDSEQRACLAAFWWQRARGEMTAWVGFQHILADLRAENSPASVIALAERAIEDEHQHAAWCRDWAMQFGHPGGQIVPRSERQLAFRGATAEQNRLLRIAFCCMTETAGCLFLRHVRPQLIDPELRALNRRNIADELQHSRVGWGHLATLGAGQREFLAGRIAELRELLLAVCCGGAEKDREDLVPWGYFTPRLLRAAHDEAVRDVIEPAFVHLGLRGAA
ncbi:MAG TPA: ferritin-like domain-containing protein [Polyangiaceae bacterium]|jgi:hypothetical protein